MKEKSKNEWEASVDLAVEGDKKALELLIFEIQDTVFNLSLRMLGTIPDAEDASQEILIKVMTHLSSFRKESSFTTWVFRIAVNHLKDYKKSMFAQRPLSFEIYGEDIKSGREKDIPDLTKGVEKELLEEELKMSCTNVLLQCLDKESRCIYILGTMFQVDSRIAGEILELTPEAYRKRLSRIREKVAAFMSEYCGLSGTGMCSCKRRVNYAIATHRLSPGQLDYSNLDTGGEGMIKQCRDTMEKVDELSLIYANMPFYGTSEKARALIERFLQSEEFKIIAEA